MSVYVCACVYVYWNLLHLYSRNQAASRRANLNATFDNCLTYLKG